MKTLPLLLLCLLAGRAAAADVPGPVTAPPAALGLAPFYKKYVSAGGLPIVASGAVDDHALLEVAYLANLMLAKRPDVRAAMIANGSRVIIMGRAEFTTDIPEYAHMKPKEYWDARARGLGGSETDPVCSCSEENVLAFPGDPYAAENIFIHEFAHNIHLRGMLKLDPTFDKRLKETYQAAMASRERRRMAAALVRAASASTRPAVRRKVR